MLCLSGLDLASARSVPGTWRSPLWSGGRRRSGHAGDLLLWLSHPVCQLHQPQGPPGRQVQPGEQVSVPQHFTDLYIDYYTIRYSVVGITEHFNISIEVLEAYLPGKYSTNSVKMAERSNSCLVYFTGAASLYKQIGPDLMNMKNPHPQPSQEIR